jgi:hypothetical protein
MHASLVLMPPVKLALPVSATPVKLTFLIGLLLAGINYTSGA